MERKFLIEVIVDDEKLKKAYEAGEEKEPIPVPDMIEYEMGWVHSSGIAVTKVSEIIK